MSLASPSVAPINLSQVWTRPGDRYVIAARQVLRKSLVSLWGGNVAMADASIDLMPDERPKPNCGLVFVALRAFEQIESGPEYELVRVRLQAAVTLRTSGISGDLTSIVQEVRSRFSSGNPKLVLSWVAQAVRQSLADNAKLLLAISNAEHPNEPNLLHELLPVDGEVSPPEEVTASHFWGPQHDAGTREGVGLLQRLQFDRGLWKGPICLG